MHAVRVGAFAALQTADLLASVGVMRPAELIVSTNNQVCLAFPLYEALLHVSTINSTARA
jgi:hypothetical protein